MKTLLFLLMSGSFLMGMREEKPLSDSAPKDIYSIAASGTLDELGAYIKASRSIYLTINNRSVNGDKPLMLVARRGDIDQDTKIIFMQKLFDCGAMPWDSKQPSVIEVLKQQSEEKVVNFYLEQIDKTSNKSFWSLEGFRYLLNKSRIKMNLEKAFFTETVKPSEAIKELESTSAALCSAITETSDSDSEPVVAVASDLIVERAEARVAEISKAVSIDIVHSSALEVIKASRLLTQNSFVEIENCIEKELVVIDCTADKDVARKNLSDLKLVLQEKQKQFNRFKIDTAGYSYARLAKKMREIVKSVGGQQSEIDIYNFYTKELAFKDDSFPFAIPLDKVCEKTRTLAEDKCFIVKRILEAIFKDEASKKEYDIFLMLAAEATHKGKGLVVPDAKRLSYLEVFDRLYEKIDERLKKLA